MGNRVSTDSKPAVERTWLGEDTPASSHYVGHQLRTSCPAIKLGEYNELEFSIEALAPLLKNMFYENIYFSMVLNKKDELAYKSHKLLITLHTFYQLLLGVWEHLYVFVSFQFYNQHFHSFLLTSLSHFSKVGIKPLKPDRLSLPTLSSSSRSFSSIFSLSPVSAEVMGSLLNLELPRAAWRVQDL